MKKTILLLASVGFFTVNNLAQTVSDLDGNIYDTVHIGSQVWMKENLKTTKYNDGSLIPLVKDSIAWFTLTSSAYCWYKNDSVTYKNTYGALYNWYTINTNKLCPAGWHVPSNAEWHIMILTLDPAAQDCYCTESSNAGDAIKEAGLTNWGTGNNGNNSSGFTALGAGFRNYYNKSFQGKTAVTYFWTSTPNTPYATVWHRWMSNNSSNVYEYLDQKIQGMSVRCIQDAGTTGEYINTNPKNILKTYPNPAIDILYIDCSEKMNIQMQVYNMIGDCIMQKELNAGINAVDIKSLINGIYIVQFTGIDWREQYKFIKE
jgi:uncharacterized protein (TIGR02145 family)